MLTLRGKMTVVSISVVMLVLLISSVALSVLFSNSLSRGVDKLLGQDIELIEEILSFDENRMPTIRLSASNHERGIFRGSGYQIRMTDGKVLLSSAELAGVSLPFPKIKIGMAHDDVEEITLGNKRYRLRSRIHLKINHAGPYDLVIQAIRPLRPYEEEGDRLKTLLYWLFPFPIALVGFGSWFVSAYTLRPINKMVDVVRGMEGNDLNQRLTINRNDELGRLAKTFNHLLDRLQKTFAALHRFTADASHELRTPLTVIRSQAEIVLSRERTVSEYREAIGSILEETARLERLTDTLLLLARGDANLVEPKWELVDMSYLVNTWIERFSVIREEKEIHLVSEIQEGVIFMADRCILDRILVNLLSNAVNYTPLGGVISIVLRVAEDFVNLTVSNSGPSILIANRETIFQRFVRLDNTRGSIEGAGLGLAIVKWAVEFHEGTVRVESAEPEGNAFIVRLPMTMDLFYSARGDG